MITLRSLQDEDIPAVKAWPAYPPEFSMLDYALRDGGWLDEYGSKERTEILVAEDEQGMIGFCLLSRESGCRAEFRIALHPQRLGQGFGKKLAQMTIRHAFSDPSMQELRLIVRKNNPRAERLYISLGFRFCGECTEPVHGEPVAFWQMVIDRISVEGVEKS